MSKKLLLAQIILLLFVFIATVNARTLDRAQFFNHMYSKEFFKVFPKQEANQYRRAKNNTHFKNAFFMMAQKTNRDKYGNKTYDVHAILNELHKASEEGLEIAAFYGYEMLMLFFRNDKRYKPVQKHIGIFAQILNNANICDGALVLADVFGKGIGVIKSYDKAIKYAQRAK